MVAYEERFSASDRDIYVQLLDPTGAPGLGVYIELTSAFWADTMVMTSSSELPTALSVFNQGNTLIPAGFVLGQGVRCAGGTIKRLYAKAASGGVATAPVGADPSVSVRSAALGDPLVAGSTRYYYVYYRDGVVLGGCTATSTFNVTQALRAIWAP